MTHARRRDALLAFASEDVSPSRGDRAGHLKQLGLSEELACPERLADAYAWLCTRRSGAPADADVWLLRFERATALPALSRALRAGEYRLGPVAVRMAGDKQVGIWGAEDALVLRALAGLLGEKLGPLLSRHCYHLKGRGGGKAAVRRVAAGCADATFVLKSDVRSYFASVRGTQLLRELNGLMRRAGVVDDGVLGLIAQYVDRLEDVDGALRSVTRGIPQGCPLAPFLGAVYLHGLDAVMEAVAAKHGLVYARYVDDWVLLTRTRWQLRAAVRGMNRVLSELGMEKARDKTFIGRVARGFDFLGYRLGDVAVDEAVLVVGGDAGAAASSDRPPRLVPVGLARQTVVGCLERLSRLYERGATVGRLGGYLRAWWRWVVGGGGGSGQALRCPSSCLVTAGGPLARRVCFGFCFNFWVFARVTLRGFGLIKIPVPNLPVSPPSCDVLAVGVA